MLRFVLSRILQGLVVLLAIYAITFILVALTPGSPFSSERAIRPEILAQIEAFYGFDKPPAGAVLDVADQRAARRVRA